MVGEEEKCVELEVAHWSYGSPAIAHKPANIRSHQLSGLLHLSWSGKHVGQVGHLTAACPRGTETKGGMNQN